MPVLSSEPSLAPEDLFMSRGHMDFTAARWWVVHTRPRAEKVLARQLHRRGVSFFLPLYERSRRLQRRLVTSWLPLFPGYVFLRGTEDSRYAALETKQIVGCIHVEEQERLAEDLARIYDLIHSGAPLAPEERLGPGMAAEITSGPLAGHRGVVVRRGKSMRLVIAVDFLQRGASLEVDSASIQPA